MSIRQQARDELDRKIHDTNAQTSDTEGGEDSHTSKIAKAVATATKRVRSKGLQAFLKDAPTVLALLDESGFTTRRGPLSASAIETTLIEDPFWTGDEEKSTDDDAASTATVSYDRVNPKTNKPRRRYLVVMADRVLRLIADARAIVAESSDPTPPMTPVNKKGGGGMGSPNASFPLSPTGEAHHQQQHQPKLRVRPGIPVHPQLFLLAYHTAARTDPDVDATHVELAQQTIAAIEVVKNAIAQHPGAGGASANTTELANANQSVTRALFSFTKVWREYVRFSQFIMRQQTMEQTADLKSQRGRVVELAEKELVQSTVEAFVALKHLHLELDSNAAAAKRATSAHVATPTTDEDAAATTTASAPLLDVAKTEIQSQLDALERRVERIGGEEGLRMLRERVLRLGERGAAKKPPTPPAQDTPNQQQEEQQQHHQVPLSSPNTSPEAHKPQPRPFIVVPAAPLPSSSMGGAVTESEAEDVSSGTEEQQQQQQQTASLSASLDQPPPAANNKQKQDQDQTPVSPFKARSTPMGPGLPPNWTTAPDGHSIPPPEPTMKERQAMKRRDMESRAVASYKAKIGQLNQSNVFVDKGDEQEKAMQMLKDQFLWNTLTADLQKDPPNYSHLSAILGVIADGLMAIIPRRAKQMYGQEIRDVLDWSVLQYNVKDRQMLVRVTKYVIGKVLEFGAPARRDEIEQELGKVERSLLKDPPHISVVAAFRFVLESLRQLKEDIIKYTLEFMKPEIGAHAVELQRDFITNWMVKPDGWMASIMFLKETCVANLPPNHPDAVAPSALILPGAEASIDFPKLKVRLARGIVNLLRSARKDPSSRWSQYPTELMYFDKAAVFSSANLVQLCSLRLMILGTVNLVLGPHKVQPPSKVINFMQELDTKLREWIGGRDCLTLDKLKSELVTEVNAFLVLSSHEAGALKNTGHVDFLKDSDVRLMHTVLDKVSDVKSNEYSLYDTKVADGILFHVLTALAELDGNQEITDGLIAPKLGQASNDVEMCAKDLVTVIQHLVEVYKPYLVDLLRAAAQ